MKILQRSQKHKIIGGVCGGIGEYFDIDPVFIRLLFIVVSIVYGMGIIAYIVLWIIVPSAPIGSAYSTTEETNYTNADNPSDISQNNDAESDTSKNGKNTDKIRFIIGLILLFIGVLILINELVPYIDSAYIWSAAFIIVGGYLVILSLIRKKNNEE